MIRQSLSTSKAFVADLTLEGKTLVMLAKHMHRQGLLVAGLEAALLAAVELVMQLQWNKEHKSVNEVKLSYGDPLYPLMRLHFALVIESLLANGALVALVV